MISAAEYAVLVRKHVERLRAGGGSCESIAQAAGVGAATVHALVNGDGMITAARGERLRAVIEVQPVRLDANGCKWRLRSLLAMGHSCARIAAAMGVSAETVRRLVSGDTRTLDPGLLRAVHVVFERWWDKTPPERTRDERRAAEQARRRAERNSWPAAMGLDEEILDWLGYRPSCGWRPATGTGVADDIGPITDVTPICATVPGRAPEPAGPADPDSTPAREAAS